MQINLSTGIAMDRLVGGLNRRVSGMYGCTRHDRFSLPSNRHRLIRVASMLATVLLFSPCAWAVVGSTSGSSIFNGVYVNQTVGATAFYTMGFSGSRAIVANIEAGAIWNGHESLSGRVSQFIAGPTTANTKLGQYDWHATMVGQTIGGNGPYQHEVGIAPTAQLWSGSIATQWDATTGQDYSGSFEITDDSFFYAYSKAMRTGISTTSGSTTTTLKANIINSSWGFSDSAGRVTETIAIDALLKENNVVGVFAAGNAGPTTNSVGGPSSGYNGIAVAAMTGDSLTPPFSQLASFSSRGPGDFFNPATQQTFSSVRPVVDIAAPGDNLTLAFYGGVTGGHVAGTDPTAGNDGAYQDQYYIPEMAGTSFAAPIVAGAAALLVDAGTLFVSGNAASSEMLDARVIKATLMASSTATTGWNNGQTLVNGVMTTTQALDNSVGAGMLNLNQAYGVYIGDPSSLQIDSTNYVFAGEHTTLGIAGNGGGSNLALRGWDLGSVVSLTNATGNTNSYAFGQELSAGSTLTAALTWFADRTLGNTLLSAADIGLSNLSLELLRTDIFGGESLVAQSIATYSSSEFLRLSVPATGSYSLRIVGQNQNYNLASSPTLATDYGLAWSVSEAVIVPEPSQWALLVGAGLMLVGRRKALGSLCFTPLHVSRQPFTTSSRRPCHPCRRSAVAQRSPPSRCSESPCD